MNETTIKINGKNTLIQFGTWVIQELIEKGYELENLGDEIKRNPFKFIPLVIYLGACNAKNMDLSDYELKDFYKFIDKEGFNSKTVTDVIELFTKSMTTTLGVDESDTDEVEVNEKVAKKGKVNFDEEYVSFAVGELGLGLVEFYKMSWREFLLKSFAYNRMQLDKWEHTRFIAYKATLAPHLNHKFIPKSIEKFFPLKRKINQIDVSDEAKQVYIEHYKKYLEEVTKANQN